MKNQMSKEEIEALRTLALNTETVEFVNTQDGGNPEFRQKFDAVIIARLIDTLRADNTLVVGA